MNKAVITLIKGLCATGAAIAVYFFAPDGMPEPAKRTLAVFVWAALFWVFEIIPLYATSLGVVLLLTFLLCRPGGILGMDESGYAVFMLPFGSPVIMLFFGGLVIAAAVQKYSLDKMLASKALKLFGFRPYSIMCGFIFITAFLSMWMSNTAVTAMMMALIRPLLKQIDEKDPFRVALILSIPFAANIGGIGTPIGTPPNAIAIGILGNYGIHLNFISWMKMAVPLAVILLFFTSIVLIRMFPPKTKELNLRVTGDQQVFSPRVKAVIGIIVLTIILWLTSGIHKIPAALIALLATGLFSASGLLQRDDYKNIDWDILILMWGGLALGKGLEISGLSSWIVQQPIFEYKGFLLVAIFSLLAILLGTFMSNTATANLIIPIAMAIPGENHLLLAVAIALSCSFAMALPISTPPNAIAFSSNMLKSRDLLKAGVLVSFISVGLTLAGVQYILSWGLK